VVEVDMVIENGQEVHNFTLFALDNAAELEIYNIVHVPTFLLF
jgi:hypothetical protein